MDVAAAHLEGAAAHATGLALAELASRHAGDVSDTESDGHGTWLLVATDIAALSAGDARDVEDRRQAERLRS